MSTTLFLDEQPPTPTDADVDRAVLAWFPDGSGCWGIGTTKQEAQARAVELRREWAEPPCGWESWAATLRFVEISGLRPVVRAVLGDLHSAQNLLNHHGELVRRTDDGPVTTRPGGKGANDDAVTTYREPTGEGVSLVVTYDPDADDFTLDGVITDDEGLDDDLDDGLDDEGLDSNPCPRPPECGWCDAKGCDACRDAGEDS